MKSTLLGKVSMAIELSMARYALEIRCLVRRKASATTS
jgi:hypothetical protein